MVCQLSDDDVDDEDDLTASELSPVSGAMTSCHCVGQLLTFILYSYAVTVTPTVLTLLGLLPLALFAFLAAEIRLRLAVDEGGGTSWGGGRGRRRYVAVPMDDQRTTWLPRYNPLESPRKDRIRPLFDDRSAR